MEYRNMKAKRIALAQQWQGRLDKPNHPGIASLDKGGEPPDDGDMQKRVEKLESDLTAMKMDMAVIRANYATRADISVEASSIRAELHKEISAQTWKLITFVSGFGTALVGVTYFIFTHSVR
jgi:hypothetical protein